MRLIIGEKCFDRKERAVRAELRREGVSFWPVAFSLLGIFHPEKQSC